MISDPSSVSSYIKNFPFPTPRPKQIDILKEIESAGFNSGYTKIILESPTGSGKSAIAISVAMSLGSSYTVVSTKELQSQYAKDFPWVRMAKGKTNFQCEVKDDFIKSSKFVCKPCGGLPQDLLTSCNHASVAYGPCMSKVFGCKYKTILRDYQVTNKGTKDEIVSLGQNEEYYRKAYSEWDHLKDLTTLREWRPCQYFHQLYTAIAGAHSILNYSIFLGFLFSPRDPLPPRELLISDEAHLLEEEVLKCMEITISRKRWRKYLPDLQIDNRGYGIDGWIDFLKELWNAQSIIFLNILIIGLYQR